MKERGKPLFSLYGEVIAIGGFGARLRAIADCVPHCAVAADIGADHGLLAEALLRERCEKLWVCDKSERALARARQRLERYADRAIFRCADGLEALEGDVQAIVLAGMGGRVLSGILQRGREKAKNSEYILAPSAQSEELRRWLVANGFRICAETVARDAGRYYPILRVVEGWESVTATPLEWRFGWHALRERQALLRESLTQRLCVVETALLGAQRAGDDKRSGELRAERDAVKEALDAW